MLPVSSCQHSPVSASHDRLVPLTSPWPLCYPYVACSQPWWQRERSSLRWVIPRRGDGPEYRPEGSFAGGPATRMTPQTSRIDITLDTALDSVGLTEAISLRAASAAGFRDGVCHRL